MNTHLTKQEILRRGTAVTMKLIIFMEIYTGKKYKKVKTEALTSKHEFITLCKEF